MLGSAFSLCLCQAATVTHVRPQLGDVMRPLPDFEMCDLDPSQLPRARKVLAELEKLARVSWNSLNSSLPLKQNPPERNRCHWNKPPLCSQAAGAWASISWGPTDPRRQPINSLLPHFCPVAGAALVTRVPGGLLRYRPVLPVSKRDNFGQWQRYGRCLLGLRTVAPKQGP